MITDTEAVNGLTPRKTGLFLLNLFRDDLLSCNTHSRDFSGSRAEYIAVRVRILAIALAIITPLWIPVDFLLLSVSQAVSITVMRVVATLLFLCLGLWVKPLHDLHMARLKLWLLIGLLGTCYVSSQIILNGSTTTGLLVAYNFLPYMLITIPAIFPLTCRESLALTVIIILLVAALEFFSGVLLTIPALAELWLMGLLAGIAMCAQMTQLHMLLSLYRQATRDPLTSLYNRRAFMERLGDEYNRARRYKRPMTILLFDLDRFKRINDTYGHLTGDYILQTFAELLTKSLRTTDLIGRYGGEEFLVLLPETRVEAAQELAERIRKAYEFTPLHGPHNETVNATVSGGIAELQDGEQANELIKRVDDCLYEAKQQGRNQTVVSR